MALFNFSLARLYSAQRTSSTNPYVGIFSFKKGVLTFWGVSIPLQNVTQISNYPVEYQPVFSLVVFILHILLTLTFFPSLFLNSNIPLSALPKVAFLFFLALSIFGVWERSRPLKYGITIELSSGFRHYFIHQDRAFINRTYGEFVTAVQENKDYQVVFENTSIMNIGDNNSINELTGVNISVASSQRNNYPTSSETNINIGNSNVAESVIGNSGAPPSGVTQSSTINIGEHNVTGNIIGNDAAQP
jgi:hypothetical protein